MTDESDNQNRFDGLYRIAVLLTGSEESAGRLLERVVRSNSDGRDGHARRIARLSGLINESAVLHQDPQIDVTRRLLADSIRRSRFPEAFATLSASDRLVLILRHGEHLAPEEVETLLQLPLGAFDLRYDETLQRLFDQLRSSTTPVERQLLLDDDPDEWIGDMVRETVRAFPAIPAPLAERLEEARIEIEGNVDRTNSRRMNVTGNVVAALVLLSVLVGSLWWLRGDGADQPKPTDLLALSVERATDLHQDLTGASEQVAEEYLYDRTGRQIVVPRFRDASLVGTSVERLEKRLSVPALQFQDELAQTDASFTIFVYDYRMLGNEGEAPAISPAVLRSLNDEISYTLAPVKADTVLVWRHRTNIYVAVGPTTTIKSLQDRAELRQPLGSR